MLKETRHGFEINGKKCYFSSGNLALKSESAVLAGMGDTVVLVNVNTKPAKADQEWFPLMVDYLEKMYAAGKISGSRFVKRDRFPTSDAVLRARMIDRSFRPKFPADFRNEVQIIVKVLSFDTENDPVLLAINAVSTALMLSKAPFTDPIAATRIGMINDEATPFYQHVIKDEMGDSTLNLVVAGDDEKFTNIDSNSNEISEEKMVEALELAQKDMQPWLQAQKDFVAMFDEVEKPEYESFALDEEMVKKVQAQFGEAIVADMGALNRNEEEAQTMEAMTAEFEGEYSKRELREAYEAVSKKEMKKLVLEDGKRADGRDFKEIREVGASVDLLPKVHGSGVFTRGLTQIMTIATLGTSRTQMTVDDMTGEGERRYLHYYIEEPFVYGDTGRVSYIPGRRAVGHGALAEKALYPVLPNAEDFPYTMILFSEIMSEMGSSSMGSVCGSTLALMDAGVPITRPVAGIAVGIVADDEMEDYKLVTDMIAVEDFFGGMDFKVAGTTEGITAIQMDTKTQGLTMDICKEALSQAKEGRLSILESMSVCIAAPRDSVSANAPKVDVVKIPEDKVGELIGPGGKNIKALIESTGADFDIQDDGSVNIFANTQEAMDAAKAEVEIYAFEPKMGEVYEGVVAGIKEFGCFVDIVKGVSGLVHVSELTDGFVKDVEEFVKLGDKVKVKVIGMERGKIKLSMKQAK